MFLRWNVEAKTETSSATFLMMILPVVPAQKNMKIKILYFTSTDLVALYRAIGTRSEGLEQRLHLRGLCNGRQSSGYI